MENNNSYKLGRALFFAPLTVPTLTLLIALTLGADISGLGLIMMTVTLVISYLATMFVGLPAFYVLYRFDYLNLITLGVVGALLGAVVSATVFSSFNLFDEIVMQLLWGALMGFIVSLTFGLFSGVRVFNRRFSSGRKF